MNTSTFINYGREFQTVVFTNDNEANSYMANNPEWGLLGTAKDGTLHLAKLIDQGVHVGPVEYMRCTCCGSSFQGRQFSNQDTGFGLGDCCVAFVTPRCDDVARTYGRSGVHFCVDKNASYP